VDRKEDVEDVAIPDLRRIELHLHDFRVSGIAVADLLVRRMVHVPARITRLHRHHAVDAQKHRFKAPETPAAEGGGFDCLTHGIPPWIVRAGPAARGCTRANDARMGAIHAFST
jgi:hypothetical protein